MTGGNMIEKLLILFIFSLALLVTIGLMMIMVGVKLFFLLEKLNKFCLKI